MGTGKITIFNGEHQPVFEGQFAKYVDAAEALAGTEGGRVALWEQTNPACGDEDCLCALVKVELDEGDALGVAPAFGKGVQPQSSTPFAEPCQPCIAATIEDTLALTLDSATAGQLPN